jgi:uncharacterized membrane protein
LSAALREYVGALIAFVLVVTFCFIVAFDIVQGKPYSVPDAFLAIVVSVVSYFFGQHAATNGAYAAGVIASQTAAVTAVAQATGVVPNAPTK